MVETSILAMFGKSSSKYSVSQKSFSKLTTIAPRKTQDNFEINIQKTTLIKKSWAPLFSNPPKKYWCQTIMKKTHGFEL